MHVVFTIDAPKVDTEAVRAASDLEKGDEGRLLADDRAVFTAVLDARRGGTPAADLELAIDHRRLHFFDPETGEALAAHARAVAVACAGSSSPVAPGRRGARSCAICSSMMKRS